MKTILWFTGGILLLLVAIFLIPNSLYKFALDKEEFLTGEYWRIGTYSFAHINWKHLIENLVGLGLVGFIALELKTTPFGYILTYFSSAFFAVLPLWLIVSFIAVGSSSAIYALFGFVSFKAKKFDLKTKYILLGLILIIFSSVIFSYFSGGEELKVKFFQSLAHFSGLVFGVVLYGITLFVKDYSQKKKHHLLSSM